MTKPLRIKKPYCGRKKLIVLLLGCLLSAGAQADLPTKRVNVAATPFNSLSGKTPVNIYGVVIAPPPCVINNGNTIDVDFGEVMITRIDGVNYMKPVKYTVKCEKMPANAMKMMISGNTASFDRAVLQTNHTGLGIAVIHNGQKLPVNDWMKFTYPDFPELHAVPVKNMTAVLKGGGFGAAATMMVEYQ
ncbi:fimbrial protein [Photorhabdus temperata subsp. temperata]|uniref:P pilus assembly protein, pilin FimA n=2 Tax=Photorhabdus temperata TaxID=574560 RepID=A0A081RRJ5_PHOTE|nr:fimbrial protein [Photorhabdus temperata]EQC01643.1 MrfE protein [Photorhabdus temperata subsp. temperata M1021]ERT11127.1 yfc fimbriae subunit yfcq [Photorhabdus temperata J3]KER01298.1 P pilus assembly protein, pilin FimA [Photorhabdus temperata subsp. temperata Meg1]